MAPPAGGTCPAVQLPPGPGPAGLAAQPRFHPNGRNHQVRPQKRWNISCAGVVLMF